MLQNAYFLAKIDADTAENEQHFAEILPKTGNYPTGPPRVPVKVRESSCDGTAGCPGLPPEKVFLFGRSA